MGGGMECHKNKYIEDWGAARENLDKTYRFTRRNLGLLLAFGVVVPMLVYRGTVAEFRSQEKIAGKPPRKFM